MSVDTKQEILKAVRQRRFLNKEFDAFRQDIIEYARTYYRDRINDFSEVGLGGVFVDMAAYVGDVMSFYLDHQFTELSPDTAVETQNIQNHLRNAGVEIIGASPAVCECTFYVEIPAQIVNNVVVPQPDALPIINDGTIVDADNGTHFILLDNLDFTLRNADGTLACDYVISDKDANGTPKSFVLKLTGICISGNRTQETFVISDFKPFRQLTLSNNNVTQIESVYDSFGNTYYEVKSLAEDVVYRGIANYNKDGDVVKEILEVIPAPYRFTRSVNLGTRSTTITLGGGSADTLEDDVIPDPSTFALPLYGRPTFSRIEINPQQLLTTKTLGVAAANTVLTVGYRYGGGLSHNAPAGSIKNIRTLQVTFPKNPSAAVATRVRSSIEVSNKLQAVGGDDAPSIDELKVQIPQLRNAQERIVTKPDLLARVYTMPSNFGRVFRAAVRDNPNNPLASQLFIISRNSDSQLVTSPDTLKNNLRTYLNDYRMISDAIDILDAQVVDISVNFEIVTDPQMNKKLILQSIIQKLQKFFDIKNFQIDQPIVIHDVQNLIFNTIGVITINNLRFDDVVGTVNNRVYSDVYHDIRTNTVKGLIIPPPGGIFEVRFPQIDIVGKAL